MQKSIHRFAPAVLVIAFYAGAQEWRVPAVSLPASATHPLVACTAEELGRLRAAYAGRGAAHDVVAGAVEAGDEALTREITFPPRGGQHNQWYQCEKCQLGLRTIDATHHQCPRCKTVYSGEPYDDVVFSHVHGRNLRAAQDAAWAYAITGKRPYAEFAAKVLLGYAQRYRQYPFHDSRLRVGDKASKSGGRLYEQTLTEASAFVGSIAPAYDLIQASGVLSPEDDRAVREGLILPMLRTIDGYKAGKSNWQTWHNAAMLWGGALLGDAAWVTKALADPNNGFAFQMANGVTSDGMWYENSWGYHFYTLSAMVDIAEGARRLGIDVWSHPSLKKMFLIAPRYAMADGSLPRFGDDVRTYANRSPSLVEAAYNAYHDPQLAAELASGVTWESVLLGRPPVAKAERPKPRGSDVFPGAGHAILRTQGNAGLTAALTFGPYGGGHGHYDKLSFVLFGYGKEIGVDPGRASSQAYRLPIHKDWYKATLGHNAVLVDGASQAPATGKLEVFAANESYAAVVASCDAAYPGTSYRRVLCLTPTYAIVVDELSSEKEHRFDWLFHDRSASVKAMPAGKGADAEALPFPGRSYMRNLASTSTDGPIRVDFNASAMTTRLAMAAAPQTEVSTADGPASSVLDRVPMAVVTRKGKTALFAATIEPAATGHQPAITAVSAGQTGDGINVQIENGSEPETLTLSRELKLTLTRGQTLLLSGEPH